MPRIILLINNKRKLLTYAGFSVIATIIDASVVWVLKHQCGLPITSANTVGVTVGFLVHYLMASKRVFDQRYGLSGFIIYLSTFIIGLCLSDLIIWLSYDIVFRGQVSTGNFLISKGIAAFIPFLFLYYLRALLYGHLRQKTQANKSTVHDADTWSRIDRDMKYSMDSALNKDRK